MSNISIDYIVYDVDTQREKAYKWEDYYFSQISALLIPISEQEIEYLVTDLFQRIGISSPRIVFLYEEEFSEAIGGHTIRLNLFGHRPYIVLHECAHILTYHMAWKGLIPGMEPAHGPTWMATYILLATIMYRVDMNKTRDSAINHGLQVAELEATARLFYKISPPTYTSTPKPRTMTSSQIMKAQQIMSAIKEAPDAVRSILDR